MFRLITFFTASTLSLSAFSWWDVGHEVVGEIAWSQLDESSRSKLNELFKELTPIYEEAASLATISKLPDNMRSGFKIFDSWHYISLPYLVVEGVTPPPLSNTNIVWALCESIRSIRNNQPNPNFQPKAFEKAFMLPFLVHLLGDIHQPMHAVTRFPISLPEGDQGGNLFLLKVGKISTNLHTLWDTGLGLFNDPFAKWTPMSSKSPNSDAFAKSIMSEFPKTHFGKKIEEMVVRQWALESHELAKKVAYNLNEGSEPTKEYISHGQKLAKERVALAGYRLAYLLKKLLNEGSESLVTGCPF